MQAYRYEGDHKGWAALGLGNSMTGALMFILYGDPKAPGSPLTMSVRTANGHYPPTTLDEAQPPFIPEVDITYSQFDEYHGAFTHEDMGKPSHVAVADFIVRGYDKWHAVQVSNASTKQPFIWSSNFKQDFEGDFSVNRHIDMHLFGLGFGWLYIDLQNAQVPSPGFYGEIRDAESHKGVNEIDDPFPPTDEELANGEAYIKQMRSGDAEPPATEPEKAPANDEPAGSGEGTLNPNPDVEQPVHSHKQFSIRSVMWHIHGVLMIFAFLVLYPLGVYLLRSGRPTSFNYHWTIQSLGNISVALGALIGYFNSHGISIPHQFAGFVIVALLAVQSVLGWRHHVFFVQHHFQQKNWLSPAHIWIGRVLAPVSFINIFTGLKLREYGWFTIALVLLVMLLELLGLFWYLRGAHLRNKRAEGGAGGAAAVKLGGLGGGRANGTASGEVGTEAEEEYFQLGDEDEFSDSDAEAEAEADQERKAEEKRARAQRLAKLDRV
jgi:hypothetical protein